MKFDLLNTIKACKIFASLDDVVLKKLLEKFEEVHLLKNKVLFRQGDLSDALYLVVSGRLVAVLKTEHNEERFLGEAEAGETLGELGALSHEPRTMTIRALENSILLKLPAKIFVELCNEHPAMILAMMNVIANRSRNVSQLLSAGGPDNKHIAIIPANKNISLKLFSEQLAAQIKGLPGVSLLRDDDAEFLKESSTMIELQDRIDRIEKATEIILYLLEKPDTDLAKICFKKVDILYVVASDDSKPHIDKIALEKIHNNHSSYKNKAELILLHAPDCVLPQHTSKWLKLAHFGLHHHVRIDREQDYQRLLRFMHGQAIGLVLGGGGVRGWAHVGAIKALSKMGIPIDIIGGTSGGAILAGYYALHETCDDPRGELKKLSDITRNTVSFKNVTWPAISIFNSKAYTLKQKKMFAGARIENLWIPFFCMVSNLSRNIPVVRRNGYLWKTIRSSTAVPGIFPPVVIKGELHVDGGILNNLPVDEMRKIIGRRGTIIAVELTHNNVDDNRYDFPPILPFWQTLLAKLGLFHKDYKFPPFVDTFLKALLAGSSAKQEANSMAADLLITPDLAKYSMLTITKAQESELIGIGFEATVKAIKRWRRKNASKK